MPRSAPPSCRRFQIADHARPRALNFAARVITHAVDCRESTMSDLTRRAYRPAHPRRAPHRPDHVRREGSGDEVSADRAATPAEGRAEHPDRPPRRRRLRRVERVRRPLPDAERRGARGERAEVQPLSHHGAVLADAPGAADRPQSPLVRHGRHHRDRHGSPGYSSVLPNTISPIARDAPAERLRHGAVRQVSRSPGVADEPGRVHSTRGPPAAAASTTSTASSAARPISGIRRSTRARRRSR